jgi:ABC-type bacteriocin/lantibiotic exporter with double-glycine peptidase domain
MHFRGSLVLPFILLFVLCSESSGVWLDVPFVKQKGKGCGAACISMVLQYWNQHNAEISQTVYDAERIMDLLFSKEADGIYATDMQKYFQNHGFRAYAFQASWSDLENHLQKGRPLIVCLTGDRKATILHYVVVAGIDADQGIIFINDPEERKLMKIDWAAFEKSWKAMNSWTLLALPR